MKRYKLEFEYVSPFTGEWTKASRESEDLAGLKDQMRGQMSMADTVRRSVLLEQEVSEWRPVYSIKSYEEALEEGRKRQSTPAAPPVDRSARILADGSPVPEDRSHTTINPSTGQQRDYVVLTPEERSKGFVRPVRRSYKHLKCGSITSMGRSIAETYARDPDFYSGTYCVNCGKHLPLDEFVWLDDGSKLGS